MLLISVLLPTENHSSSIRLWASRDQRAPLSRRPLIPQARRHSPRRRQLATLPRTGLRPGIEGNFLQVPDRPKMGSPSVTASILRRWSYRPALNSHRRRPTRCASSWRRRWPQSPRPALRRRLRNPSPLRLGAPLLRRRLLGGLEEAPRALRGPRTASRFRLQPSRIRPPVTRRRAIVGRAGSLAPFALAGSRCRHMAAASSATACRAWRGAGSATTNTTAS